MLFIIDLQFDLSAAQTEDGEVPAVPDHAVLDNFDVLVLQAPLEHPHHRVGQELDLLHLWPDEAALRHINPVRDLAKPVWSHPKNLQNKQFVHELAQKLFF